MRTIPLTKGLVAIVDDDDYEELSAFRWTASPTQRGYCYAARSEKKPNGKYGTVMMHRIVNKTPAGFLTDHISGNTLDNRKANLRSATRQQNGRNSAPAKGGYSPLKGVTWHKRDKRWVTKIVIDGKPKHLGYFHTAEEAAAAYAQAATQYFGEFARTEAGAKS